MHIISHKQGTICKTQKWIVLTSKIAPPPHPPPPPVFYKRFKYIYFLHSLFTFLHCYMYEALPRLILQGCVVFIDFSMILGHALIFRACFLYERINVPNFIYMVDENSYINHLIPWKKLEQSGAHMFFV